MSFETGPRNVISTPTFLVPTNTKNLRTKSTPPCFIRRENIEGDLCWKDSEWLLGGRFERRHLVGKPTGRHMVGLICQGVRKFFACLLLVIS